MTAPRRVSVLIPARNEGSGIGAVVRAVLAQERPAGVALEVIVADDGSTDDTAAAARAAGARVVACGDGVAAAGATAGAGVPATAAPAGADRRRGNPGRARNRAAQAATGDPLIFLDADCMPEPGWLAALLAAHARGAAAVGGAVALPQGLPRSARCDYYATSYYMHPGRPARPVANHTPANLSVRRAAFLATAGFTERPPVSDGHEELVWQGALRRAGGVIRFEPRAVVAHRHHPGVLPMLRRSYRWGYSALQAKAESGAARAAWAYGAPALVIALAVPIALASALHTAGCWVRARRLDGVLLFPGILAARLAWGCGLAVGGARWLWPAEARRAGSWSDW